MRLASLDYSDGFAYIPEGLGVVAHPISNGEDLSASATTYTVAHPGPLPTAPPSRVGFVVP